LPEDYFHVFARSLPEAPAFPGPPDRNALIVLIRKCERRFALRVLAATVMTTFETLASGLSLPDASRWSGVRGRPAASDRPWSYSVYSVA